MLDKKNQIYPPHPIFADHAYDWWNESGTFQALHKMNRIRLLYLKDVLTNHFKVDPHTPLPLKGIKILDIGCGGGLVAEPLSRLGATVTGIDPSQEAITVARQHAAQFELDIFYSACTLEDLRDHKTYDVVLALEVLEHTSNPGVFLNECFQKTAPGGLCIMATLNRTLKSYLTGIIAAEYILKWAPRGTHEWQRFIKPSELFHLLEKAGFKDPSFQGISFAPLKNDWILSDTLEINYFGRAVKPEGLGFRKQEK